MMQFVHCQFKEEIFFINPLFIILFKQTTFRRNAVDYVLYNYYTVDFPYNDTEYLVRYHGCTQYIVVYDFRYIRRYLQIVFLTVWEMDDVRSVSCVTQR